MATQNPKTTPIAPPVQTTTVQYHSNDFDFEEWRAEVETREPCVPSTAETARADTSGDQCHAWERFHQQHNRGGFFKERRYLLVEFPELSPATTRGKQTSVLEIGCGSGSSVMPLIKNNPDLNVYACDFSAQAVGTAKQAVDALNAPPHRSCLFVCDVATQAVASCLATALMQAGGADLDLESDPAPGRNTDPDPEPDPDPNLEPDPGLDPDPDPDPDPGLPLGQSTPGVDHLLMVFVLSALHPRDMLAAMLNAVEALKPGGCVLFRDYGLYDLTMLRFPPSQKVEDKLYMRQDGTLSYFFTKEVVAALCADAGLVLVECAYCCVQLVNRKNGKPMRRVFVHARMMKQE